jgi:hypothetical protein
MFENEFSWLFDVLKHRFMDNTKVLFLDVQKADKEFTGPFIYLKDHFRDLVQVAFLDARR